MKWYEDTDQVTSLGGWLIDQDICDSPRALQRYYEKPWKWEAEWTAYQASAAGKPCPNHEAGIDCLCQSCDEQDCQSVPPDADDQDDDDYHRNLDRRI